MREIWHINVHCSASDYKHHDNYESIYEWHVIENGWSDVGYHYIITKNGDVIEGRDINKIPAAVKYHNSGAISIVLTGLNNFSQEQFKSLRQLVRNLQYDYKIPDHLVKGHNDYPEHRNRKCPNFNLKKVLNEVK
ncbi:MAG: N-acetylmuramoyl-L-alanine amidase [bacterium]